MRKFINRIDRAYGGMDPVVRRKSIRALFILLGLSLAGIGFLLSLWYDMFYLSQVRREQLVAEVQAFLLEPLISITVLPRTPDSAMHGVDFEYGSADREELETFRTAARQVDLGRVSGHSGDVFEVIIHLRSRRSEVKYVASVHKYEPEDLFISNEFWQKVENGYQRGRRDEVRIPGLGLWILHFAPEGCDQWLRENCYSGNLDIDFVNP